MTEQRSVLRTYLEDHWAGAGAGVALARRIADHSPQEWTDRLARVADDVATDEATLSRLRQALDVDTGWFSVGGVKRLAGRFGEGVSRLLSLPVPAGADVDRLLEVETMISGIAGKRSLWRALQHVEASRRPLGGVDLDAMIARAGSQIETMRRYHRFLSRSAFGNETTNAG